jgi:hypothetical protein
VKPIDPHAFVHYLAACKVAGVAAPAITPLSPTSLRDLIARCAAMSIPDAVRLLRKEIS